MPHVAHRTDPRRLRGEIEKALTGMPGDLGDRVEVAATAGGIVTLTGTVRSDAARRRVAAAAWTAPGVEEVLNLVRVGG